MDTVNKNLEALSPCAGPELALDRRPGRKLPRVAFYLAATAAMLLYLGQGGVAGARLAAFVFGVLFPGAALLSTISPIQRLPQGVRAITAISLAMLCVTPAFYIRRDLPGPGWLADLLFIAALCFWAQHRRAYASFWHDIASPLFRASAPFLFLALPALFVLTWMGFQVQEGGQVFYYGLFPIDFGNLTSIVALINASHGLPHWPLSGSEVVNYHWLFFAFPAWLSSFGGGHTPDAISFVVCNYIAACILFLAIAVTADHVLRAVDPDQPVAASTIAMATGVVALASLVMYPYQMLVGLAVRLTHIQSIAITARNGLLLSLPNSMTVFGNNSMALALALLALVMLLEWNRRLDKGHLFIGAAFLAMIVGYSITLVFPIALALGIWLLLGHIRKWPKAVVCLSVVGAAIIGIMAFGLHLFGSNKGLAVAFDNGAYLRHVLFALTPLWALAWMGRAIWTKLSLFWTLIICCVIVPSFLYIPNTLTGHIDFSMKIASLIAVAAVPLACVGLARCLQNWRAPVAIVALTLVALGLACTAAYAGQFAFMRLQHNHDRTMVLPSDYMSALQFIRDNTPVDAIVIDPQSVPYSLTMPTVFIAERRVFLSTKYAEQTLATAAIFSDETATRNHDFDLWAKGYFQDKTLSARFASQADYCLLSEPGLAASDENWARVQNFGDYSIWKSRGRSTAWLGRP